MTDTPEGWTPPAAGDDDLWVRPGAEPTAPYAAAPPPPPAPADVTPGAVPPTPGPAPYGQPPQGQPTYYPAAPYGDPAAGQPPYGQAGYQGYGQPQPGYVPPGPYQPAFTGYATIRTNHPHATTALVLGLVGLVGGFLCWLPALAGPFAWYFGAKARREIDASGGALDGRDQATAGMVTGIIASVIIGLSLVGIFGLVGLSAIR